MVLGYGKYFAQLSMVGGKDLLFEQQVMSTTWSRELSNISDGRVTLFDGACCEVLKYSSMLPCLELHIVRKNVCDGVEVSEIVWSGRIKRLESNSSGEYTIIGEDFASWFASRICSVFNYTNVDSNVASFRLLTETLLQNNSMGLIVQYDESGIKISDEVKEGSLPSVLDQVNELVRGNSYWTQIGRTFRLGLDCDTGLSLTEDDFDELPTVSFDVSEFANKVYVAANNGSGEGSDIRYTASDGTDFMFGCDILVEKAISTNIADQGNAQLMAEKFLQQNRDVGIIVDVNKSVLNPSSQISVGQLIPGCNISSNFATVCGGVGSDGFLRAVACSFDGVREQISLEIGPSRIEESSRKILAG